MISTCGSLVALLGGWRGDRIWLSHSGGPFELLAELGWLEESQTTPQRRILLTPDACLVLEPADGAGPLLNGELCVRRLGFEGNERGREVGAERISDPWEADWIHFMAAPRPETALRSWFRFCGIDPESGRARLWSGDSEAGSGTPGIVSSGVPLLSGGAIHLPLTDRGLLRLRRDGSHLREGHATTAIRLNGGGVCAAGIRDGVSGIWIEGDWRPLPGPAPFLGVRAPLSPLVATHGDGAGGVALLRARGGALGVVDGPAASLPEGLYSALVAIPEGLFGVTEGDSPRLVAAAF